MLTSWPEITHCPYQSHLKNARSLRSMCFSACLVGDWNSDPSGMSTDG